MDKFKDEYGNEREDVLLAQSFVRSFNDEIEEADFRIYGLVGEWGSGKTTFIRMWEKYVRSNMSDQYTILHVDAFSKDYSEDPFTMLFSAFKEYMRENNVRQQDAENLVEKAKGFAIAASKSLFSVLLQKMTDGMGKELLSTLLSELNYDPSFKEKDLCLELRNELEKIVKHTGKKLYIVIDELDRCRPDFALECLEKIKHLFAVDGIKFILVYNPKIIRGIVKSKYGCDACDARTYIHKFVEFEYGFSLNLQESLRRFIAYEYDLIVERYSHKKEMVSSIFYYSDTIAKVLLDYGIVSLREIRLVLISMCNLIKKMSREDTSNLWFVLPLLRLIDFDEYSGIASYLSQNHVFATNAPSRGSYYRIMKCFKSRADASEMDSMIESEYKFYGDTLFNY